MDVREFLDFGRRTVELLGAYLREVENRPLFPDVQPAELEALFDEPLPQEGTDPEALLRMVETKLLPYCTHVNHPGYFGLMTPTPTTAGIFADLIASTLNQNLGTWTVGPAAVVIERRTIRWLCDLVGYGPGAGGNLTSGGMMANLIGIKLARDRASGDRAQREGVRGPCAVYVSEERHVSIDKAVDLVGLGREALRALPTDDRFAVRLDALEEAIARDKGAGVRPLCVVGIAGTTNTGSVDALGELRRIADREGMWLHVDAAYGGGLLLCPDRRGALSAIERADSVTIDPHKWFYAPLDAGAVLVRDADRLTASFGLRPPYLTDETDSAGDRYQFYVHGLEQSRRFRSLKVWMGFKRYGVRRMAEWVEANIEHARRLHRRVQESGGELVSVVPPVMSGVCVRYDPGGIDDGELARIHRVAARRIEAQGRYWLSTTVLKGRPAFRINPINLRTRASDMDGLFESLRAECDRARQEGAGSVK